MEIRKEIRSLKNNKSSKNSILDLVPLVGSNDESWCQGPRRFGFTYGCLLLAGRSFCLMAYHCDHSQQPSELAVTEAAWGLTRYAAIVQVISQENPVHETNTN